MQVAAKSCSLLGPSGGQCLSAAAEEGGKRKEKKVRKKEDNQHGATGTSAAKAYFDTLSSLNFIGSSEKT